MRILYINVIELNKGWGAEYFLNKAFLKSGVETITLDYRKHRGHISRKLLEIKDDFDALLIQRGDDFPLELIKSVNRPRFFWATELVSRRRDQDRLFDSGLFDRVFVRGNSCRNALMKRNILPPERISILLGAFDPDTHYPLADTAKDIDVLFIGSMKDRRARILKELSKDFNITIAQAFGKNMTALLNRAKIVLNIHAEDYIDTETRVYEALGCGAFLITETLGSESPFTHGQHLIGVDTMADMKKNIAFYLENESARNTIAENGFKEASLKHTYQKRAEELLGIMGAYLKQQDRSMTSALDKERIRRYKKHEWIDYMKNTTKENYSRFKRTLFTFPNV